MGVIYLDNAASSWPKPPRVAEKMAECVREYAANPGRGSHELGMRADRVLFECRRKVAKLFGVRNSENVVFTQHATEALNLGMKGLLKAGDHVVTSSLEHNSVRRPLEYLRKEIGIDVTYVQADENGRLKVEDFRSAVRENTRMIVVTHGSNLTGALVPVAEIGQVAKENGVVLMVDACQTAGVHPIDVEEMNIGMLAFTGHKSLYGPQGTGGLYIAWRNRWLLRTDRSTANSTRSLRERHEEYGWTCWLVGRLGVLRGNRVGKSTRT